MIHTIRRAVRDSTRKSFWLRYALLASWRCAYAAVSSTSRRNVSGCYDEPGCNEYARTIFSHYKHLLGIERFHGRVAEVGPGNVTEVAELMLADGCSSVDQVDKFLYTSDGNADSRLRRHRSTAEEFFERHDGYDFILSCAVLEHVADPLRALRGMARALNPGGMMVHAVDCRDHQQFSDCMHDLSFLRIPKVMYLPLTLASGLNRIRLSDYVSTLDLLPVRYRILVSGLSGTSEDLWPPQEFAQLPPSLVERSKLNLDLIRPRLAQPFRGMNDSDLMISAFMIVAQRRANPS